MKSSLWFTESYVKITVFNLLYAGVNTSEEVMEIQNTKILSDFKVRTNRVIEARCSDIVRINKKDSEMLIIDIPRNFCVREEKAEKISEYQYLNLKISISNLECKN